MSLGMTEDLYVSHLFFWIQIASQRMAEAPHFEEFRITGDGTITVVIHRDGEIVLERGYKQGAKQ